MDHSWEVSSFLSPSLAGGGGDAHDAHSPPLGPTSEIGIGSGVTTKGGMGSVGPCICALLTRRRRRPAGDVFVLDNAVGSDCSSEP